MAVVQSAGSVFKWDVLGRPLTLLLLETFALCLLTLLTDQYTRTATLPWPLQRVPDACRMWAVAHLRRARSLVEAILARRRKADSSGGYRRVDVVEAEVDLEVGAPQCVSAALTCTLGIQHDLHPVTWLLLYHQAIRLQ